MYYWHWVKNVVHRPKTTGYPTALDDTVQHMSRSGAIVVDAPLEQPFFKRSVALRQVDGGSCNGCESELSLLSSPDYDLSRYGFSFVPSPKHADVLVVTGVITRALAPVIRTVYDQMTAPKRVVAVGACAIDGWVFQGAPDVLGRLDDIVPVTVRIHGCPPTPGDLLRGLLAAVDGADPASLAPRGVRA
ncbi:MAG: NADH:ubiquinone oxidoreductase [Sulfobacillus acidophilus]|uniref:NADH:ubiquinone oxidoreductase n=1 Tax=Sulfobacillus acidophilus TaxID=53633 RepID=A0A2T2WMN3_9FIRM|nr:MAG: NADH:ubiquinone oxidoreductase [Sulfobacillus acidophilus]